LKTITFAGMCVFAAALAGAGLIALGNRTDTLGSWAWPVPLLLGVGGLHLMCLGILGEYLDRIYREARGRPLSVIRERLGFLPHPHLVPDVLQWLPDEATTHQELATAATARSRWLNESSRLADELSVGMGTSGT